jgi:phage shock protein C
MTDFVPPTASRPPLRRNRSTGMIAGVASGFAEWLDVDPQLVRIGLAVATLLGFAGVALYLAAWVLIPEQGSDTSIAEDLLAGLGHQRASRL